MKVELLLKKLFYTIFKVIFRNKNIHYPLEINNISNILVLRYDAIGDMIVTLPTIRLLKHLIPNSNIDIIASKRNISIINDEKSLRNKFILKDGFIAMFRQCLSLKSNNYDLILSMVLNNTTKAGIIANIIGSRNSVKAVIAHNNRKELYSALFNLQIDMSEYRNKCTMLEIQCRFICKIFEVKFDESILQTSIELNNADLDFANVIANKMKPYIIYNISSGNEYRTFSTQKNIEILNDISSELDEFNFIILYAPQEKDKAKEIHSSLQCERIFLYDPMSLTEVSALISFCHATFTPDTSIVHIAAAFQKPVFLVYSLLSSYINEWLPYNTEYDYLKTSKKESIDNIKTEEIKVKFIQFINRIEKI